MPTSEQLNNLTDEELTEWVQLQEQVTEIDRYEWESHARPEQLPPDGDWLIWLYLGGRGAGKTRSGAEFVKKVGLREKCRIALIGATLDDVRDTMVEGESGLLSVLRPLQLRGGNEDDAWNRSLTELYLANGTKLKGFTSERPNKLRGPQHHYAWGDEPMSWKDANKTPSEESTTWSNLMLGLRLGQHPQCILTGTPKNRRLLRGTTDKPGLLQLPGIIVQRGTTYDNLANLAPTFRDQVLSRYEGTRTGRQELMAELLTDTPGALWTLDLLDDTRVSKAPHPIRVCVAVDPSGGHEESNDEQGIFAVSRGNDGDIYGLADRSCKLTPDGWARRAIHLYEELKADIMIGEKNYGGEMVQHTIETVANDMGVTVNFSLRNASRGKAIRAEPISALFEQHKGHLVGSFPELEEELTTWTQDSGWSPNRLDAFVWAATEVSNAHKMEYLAPQGQIW